MEQGVNNSSSYGLNETDLGYVSQLEQIYLLIIPMISWTMVSAGVIGVVGNILTILVFIKLGFSETIHMSYVALAVSDLCCILSTIWIGICYTPLLRALPFSFQAQRDMAQFSNFTGGWPHLAFSRTTALITSWISIERCLCVLFPIRVKLIISRTVTKVVITIIFIIGCCPFVLAYVGLTFAWKSDHASNRTSLMFNTDGNDLNAANTVAFFLYGAVYPVFSCVTVTICTTFLIVKLRQSARWRKATAPATTSTQSPGTNPRNVYRRESRTTRTVVMIASVFIICSVPVSANLVMAVFLREDYSINGSLGHLYLINAGLSGLFSEINSSLNLVFYTITGSRFRSMLVQMFSPITNE